MNNLSELIHEIKSKNAIDLLEKAGVRVVGNRIHCPSHADKNPSCVVYQDGLHCFACGLHGDVIDFFRVTEDLQFIDAVKRCANLYGIPMPERHGSRIAERFIKQKPYDFICIIQARRDSDFFNKMVERGFDVYTFETFKVLDLSAYRKSILLKPNIVIVPKPNDAEELKLARLLSIYSGAEYLNWQLCPVKRIEDLTPELIACSLSGGAPC